MIKMSKLIAVIEDDLEIGNAIEELLTGEGYRVKRAYSGSEALLMLGKYKPDLALMDLMLPGLCGEELIRHIEDIPVIVLSAKSDVSDKVNLLLSGAADYITKPFVSSELLARIAVQLRKPAAKSGKLEFGGITLDAEKFEVTAAGEAVRLTKSEYAILKTLMQEPDRVFSKAQLLDNISADTLDCGEASLSVHISNLRAKLRSATSRDCIEAVWGIGYRIR